MHVWLGDDSINFGLISFHLISILLWKLNHFESISHRSHPISQFMSLLHWPHPRNVEIQSKKCPIENQEIDIGMLNFFNWFYFLSILKSFFSDFYVTTLDLISNTEHILFFPTTMFSWWPYNLIRFNFKHLIQKIPLPQICHQTTNSLWLRRKNKNFRRDIYPLRTKKEG